MAREKRYFVVAAEEVLPTFVSKIRLCSVDVTERELGRWRPYVRAAEGLRDGDAARLLDHAKEEQLRVLAVVGQIDKARAIAKAERRALERRGKILTGDAIVYSGGLGYGHAMEDEKMPMSLQVLVSSDIVPLKGLLFWAAHLRMSRQYVLEIKPRTERTELERRRVEDAYVGAWVKEAGAHPSDWAKAREGALFEQDFDPFCWPADLERKHVRPMMDLDFGTD